MLDFVREILKEKETSPSLFKRNLVKEYLQVLTLSFLYSRKEYRNLVFYGGSCLRHCFDLPRLSEDLDFVDTKSQINLETLAIDVAKYFDRELGMKVITKTQKFRVLFKFPILHDLELAEPSESNLLFLKIEVFKDFGFCKGYKIEILPLFKFGKAVLIRTFDLPTLMATKIRAILYRKWEKTDRKGKLLASVKGRDYYDLMWYMEKKVKPNMECIEDIESWRELRKKLIDIVEKVHTRSIKFDLSSLIEDRDFVEDLGDNIKEILVNSLNES